MPPRAGGLNHLFGTYFGTYFVTYFVTHFAGRHVERDALSAVRVNTGAVDMPRVRPRGLWTVRPGTLNYTNHTPSMRSFLHVARYGCGAGVLHNERTGHNFAMELSSQRVWDYAGDNYVHRLIQNKVIIIIIIYIIFNNYVHRLIQNKVRVPHNVHAHDYH